MVVNIVYSSEIGAQATVYHQDLCPYWSVSTQRPGESWSELFRVSIAAHGVPLCPALRVGTS
jgi:hypothetical protein